MKRSWVIGGLVAGAVLVFWLSSGDKPTEPSTANKAPVPIDSYYATHNNPPAYQGYQAPAAATPQWRGDSYYSPAPAGGYSFRPRSEREQARVPTGTPQYYDSSPGVPEPLGAGGMSYTPPQTTLGYRFRPVDSDKQRERYTGNFPQPYGPAPAGPVWPSAPQEADNGPPSWNGPAPGYGGPNGLWVYSPPRY